MTFSRRPTTSPVPLVADSDLGGATLPGRGDSWFITTDAAPGRTEPELESARAPSAPSRIANTPAPVPSASEIAAAPRPAPPEAAGRPGRSAGRAEVSDPVSPGAIPERSMAGPRLSRPVPLAEAPTQRSFEPDSTLSEPAPDLAAQPPITDPGNPTFQRIFGAFVVSRALLGTLLLLIQIVLSVYAVTRPSLPALATGGAYAVLTLLTLRGSVRHQTAVSASGYLKRHWMLLTIGVDLAMFALLLVVGTGLNIAAMFALPVLMSATLTSRRVALAVAAVVSLILLAAASLQWLTGGGDAATLYTQVGLAGAGLFVISALTGELSSRLARQEEAARSTLELARQQAMLNRLVIEEMQDGLMVVDRGGHVRAANPAALALIGAPERPWASSFDLRGVPNWQSLVQAVDEAFATGGWPETGRDLGVRTGRDAQGVERQLRLRLRFTRRRSLREPLCVLFLEDLRTVQARARKEKLAAMGRVSAGIAHEIRNPLAAIAQANALLAEDLERDPHLSRLTRMVTDNVERLRRIVDDVLEFAPAGPAVPAGVLELVSQVQTICDDWVRTNNLPPGDDCPLHFRPVAEILHVRFDPDHLRRVLVNLLDNALRHGTRQARSIWVQISLHGSAGVRLWVANDGDPIAANVEPYLFEPFFSTRSRGSGLGLYICRELCERYGATIEFRLRRPPARHRNAFLVSMPCVLPETTEPPTPTRHERPAVFSAYTSPAGRR